MPEPCCGTLRGLSLTREEAEELAADPEVAENLDVRDWTPLVEWVPHIGMYCIAHVAIFYCPWFAAPLPSGDRPGPSSGERPIDVVVGPAGEVNAFSGGKQIDLRSIFSLSAANDGPDGYA